MESKRSLLRLFFLGSFLIAVAVVGGGTLISLKNKPAGFASKGTRKERVVLGEACDTFLNSDINCDGKISLIDFNSWLLNYQAYLKATPTPGLPTATPTTVLPSPTVTLPVTPTPTPVCYQHQIRGSDGGCVCTVGWENCDRISENGCEAWLIRDSNNCGSCGNQCDSNYYCSYGVCVSESKPIWGPTDPPPPPPVVD